MKAKWKGIVLADSDETIVVEGNHYFPPDSVRFAHLVPSDTRTRCLWKGVASYYSVGMGSEDLENAAWTYRKPYPWIRKIRNYVAFWRGVEVVQSDD